MSYKSVWDFGRAGVANYSVHGLGEYPTKIRPAVVAKIVERFSEAGDVILDPFCGSGTVAVEAKLQGRSSLSYDVNAQAVELTRTKLNRLDRNEMDAALRFLQQEATAEAENGNGAYERVRIEKEIARLKKRLAEVEDYAAAIHNTTHAAAVGDARRLDVADESVDAVITDIPYAGMVTYSAAPEDLSTQDYDGFLEGISAAFNEIYRVLKREKYFILFVADYRVGASRKIIPVHADLIRICSEIGFELFDLYVWRYYRSGAFRPFGKKPYQAMNVHSYILCFHKPGAAKLEKANRPVRYRARLKEKLAALQTVRVPAGSAGRS